MFCRCFYKYDALGTLYRKVCSDGSNYAYLMDPFGRYGPDVIAEVGLLSANAVIIMYMIFCALLALA